MNKENISIYLYTWYNSIPWSVTRSTSFKLVQTNPNIIAAFVLQLCEYSPVESGCPCEKLTNS